jgi:hypothetical protein
MTAGWYFSPLLAGKLSLLIPRSSVNSLEFLFSSCLRALTMLPPSMDDLREFIHAVPQGEEGATTIRIGALSAPHRMLAKIVQHNLWLVVRRSDLILKRAQFVYAIHLCLPFCLCMHILGVTLEARDESNTGLPFGCLLTQIIL